MRIAIGVFAHNEAATIADAVNDLADQSLLTRDGVHLHVLCNGCTDDTADVARAAIDRNERLRERSTVHALVAPGKSRTWNHFVHELASDADVLLFVDADIRIPDRDNLARLIAYLEATGAPAVTSHAQKDLSVLAKNPLLRLGASVIARQHADGRIAGSLYAVRRAIVEPIWLPVPCLVEDGFLASCIVTSLFRQQPDVTRVRACPGARHLFDPPDTLRAFFRHDIRMKLGIELNGAMYTPLWASSDPLETTRLLRDFAANGPSDTVLGAHRFALSTFPLMPGSLMRLCARQAGESVEAWAVRLPVRLAHAAYMSVVYCRAHHLYKRRTFRW